MCVVSPHCFSFGLFSKFKWFLIAYCKKPDLLTAAHWRGSQRRMLAEDGQCRVQPWGGQRKAGMVLNP